MSSEDPMFSENALDLRLTASRTQLNTTLSELGLAVRARVPHPSAAAYPFDDARFESIRRAERALKHVVASGRDLHDTSALLDYALKELGVRVPRDFVDHLEPGDIVEGYGLDHRQIFRNVRFFELCTYDLHDVLTYDWMTLFERTQSVTNELLARVQEVCWTGQTISLSSVPEHYVKERLSSTRQIIRMKYRDMAPLLGHADTPVGAIVSCQAKVVDPSPERHELRFI